jgi:hypothetical protein
MVPENAVVLNLNDVVLVFRVVLLEVLQNVKLDACLMLVSLLIFDDFDGHDLSCFMVEAPQSLAKATLSDEVDHFESVVDVILQHYVVVTILVIVATVVQLGRVLALYFVSLET